MGLGAPWQWLAVGVLACAGEQPPGAPATAAQPPGSPAKVAEELRSLSVAERCALLGDILALQDESLREEATAGQTLAVSATIGGAPLFGPGEGCGPRLQFVEPSAPSRYVGVALKPRPAGGYDWRAGSGRKRNPRNDSAGVAVRREGRWHVERAGQAARAPRPLDPAPRRSPLSPALTPGKAEAFFQFDTGGDVMGAPAREAGLVLVVRCGAEEWRQTIASCAEPARGNALGDPVPGGIDMAECNGRHEIISAPGLVRVDKQVGAGAPVTVTTVRLPDARTRAVAPPRR